MEEINIYQLLSSKKFDELTKEEKKQVEKNIGKESYINQYKLLNKAKHSLKQEMEETPIDEGLLHQLKTSKNKEADKQLFILFNWLHKPIPSYSFVLVLLLFTAIIVFKGVKTPQNKPYILQAVNRDIIKYDTIVLRDTVLIEKEQEKQNRRAKNELKTKPVQKTNNQSISTIVNSFQLIQLEEQLNKLGISASESDSAIAMLIGKP